MSVRQEKRKYWVLPPDEEEYKSGRLRVYQNLLRARGITDLETLRLLTAHPMIEVGSLDPSVDGDHGCSAGIPQLHVCSHFGISAKTFRSRHPEWKTWEYQMQFMATEMVKRIKKYGDVRLAIISWNLPAAANAGVDTKARYFEKVKKQSLRLVLQ